MWVGETGPRRPRRRARAGPGRWQLVGRARGGSPTAVQETRPPAGRVGEPPCHNRPCRIREVLMAWRGPRRPLPQCPLRANPGPALAELAAVLYRAGRPARRAGRRPCWSTARTPGRRTGSTVPQVDALTRDSAGGGRRRPVWSVGEALSRAPRPGRWP